MFGAVDTVKAAAIRLHDRRWVARVGEEAGKAFPFDIPESPARSGVVCLLEKPFPPRALQGVDLRDVELLAPIPHPAPNISCVGTKYYGHADEFSRRGFDSSAATGVTPKPPIIFIKVPGLIIATNSDVSVDPQVSTAIDYEAELAVIIGKSGRGISAGVGLGFDPPRYLRAGDTVRAEIDGIEVLANRFSNMR
ncbi:MAG TPA: fumarylacetoacetate hydrolase family protein [Steroidobacteraceae bacterium]|nr:fumarylacetoacetate hydrolase family protein [Steroidobacteraceae bacterium]